MAAEHGETSAQRAHLDWEQEQGVKRLKVEPSCLVGQAGSTKEFGEGVALERVKQEPDEELWRGCEAQRQPKVVGTPSSEQRPSGDQGQAGSLQSSLEGSQQPRSYEIPPLLFGFIKEPQATPLAVGKTVCKIAKGEFPVEVGREEVIPGEDTFSWDAERRRFREFCYYEAVGPTLTSVRLGTLCRQWLQPEKRTKQQILEQVIMEQFLAILPREMQSWVKAHRPDTCPRAVALAEGFLLIQEQKKQGALQKEAASILKAEEPRPDSCQRPPSREIKQEEDSDPTLGGGTVGEIKEEDPVREIKEEDPVREIKEEDLSQEDSFMESPATAEGRAQGSLSSPGEPGLVGDPKEEPGTTCNPGGGTVRKIKEENLSEEESLAEVAAPAEGGAQQSIAFPSGSAVVRFPKEEPGTTCSPCDESTREIKTEALSEEESLAEAPEMAAGGAQQSSAFPSGSVLVRLPKEEPGATCNPDSPSSARCKAPAVKSEEKPGKSGEGEAPGLALGREEETGGASGHEAAGEREEVWTGYGKTFRWKSVLTPCKATVTDWKIYQCCVCGKNYDARSIRAHQKMHTGERLYECIYCGKTFSQRSHFESHEKIHTGVKVQTRENLYICVTCGKSFAYYSTLVAHRRTHGEDDASTTG